MDRGIKIFRQLEQVFETYRVMFKELRGGGESSCDHNVSAKKIKTLVNAKTLLFLMRAVNYSRIFAFRGGSWNLTPTKSEV
jgi:hypothetical protein